MEINGEKIDLKMKLGEDGVAFFEIPETQENTPAMAPKRRRASSQSRSAEEKQKKRLPYSLSMFSARRFRSLPDLRKLQHHGSYASKDDSIGYLDLDTQPSRYRKNF